MKKWLSILVAVLLALSSVSALAVGVPSKTTRPEIVGIVGADGTELPEDFIIAVSEKDSIMTEQEVEKMYEHSNGDEKDPIITYFPGNVQDAIVAKVRELAGDDKLTVDDLKDWVINEIFSVDVADYDEAFGDVVVSFEFTTPYEMDQKMVALLGTYDGSRTEVAPNEFEFNVEWFVLDAEVVETIIDEENDETKSVINVTFTQESIESMMKAVANTVAIMSEPVEEEK